MDLTKFKTVDQAFKTTVIIAVSCCVVMGISFTICFFYLSNKIDVAYTKALVLDTSGQVYDVAAIESAAMRKYEYENHIKTFVSLWYSFDESTYEDNVTLALNLIGNRGKELYNEYNDINMLNSLIQKKYTLWSYNQGYTYQYANSSDIRGYTVYANRLSC